MSLSRRNIIALPFATAASSAAPNTLKPDISGYTTHSGQKLDGKIWHVIPENHLWAVYLGFLTCPLQCPRDQNRLKTAIKLLPPELQSRLHTMFISVDKRNTPEEMKQFVDNGNQPIFNPKTGTQIGPQINRRLVFPKGSIGLTASDGGTIQKTVKSFAAIAEKSNNPQRDGDIAHTGHIYLINNKGQVVMIINPSQSPEQIAQELKNLFTQDFRRILTP